MANFEKHLVVYQTRSEYLAEENGRETFEEGPVSTETKQRTLAIDTAFKNGFVENAIKEARDVSPLPGQDKVSATTKKNLEVLVESVTSEVGRALVGLTVMQLCIKAIDKNQNIRLHKGGVASNAFSWRDGISMRTLDKKYVTPALRKFDLLKLNADGFMMTRSLAENYPYSPLYKAQLRGARDEWLAIVEELQAGTTDPKSSLLYLLALLFNNAENFKKEAGQLIQTTQRYLQSKPTKAKVLAIFNAHITQSGYAARLMEVSMHALMQAATSMGAFALCELKPLSQMRSANKKHGNIGDIELLESGEIIEAWDAKYGKHYLRDEIDEVVEKIGGHHSISTLGFVTSEKPTFDAEIRGKLEEYKDSLGIGVQIITFEAWVERIFGAVTSVKTAKAEASLAAEWLTAYAESIGQLRREQAPIDEPCIEWVKRLKSILEAAI